jgi:hypothetical protein
LSSIRQQGFINSPAKTIDLGTGTGNRIGVHFGVIDTANAAHTFPQFTFAGTGGGDYIPMSREIGTAADWNQYADQWVWICFCWDGRSATAAQRTFSIYIKPQGASSVTRMGRVFEGETWANRFGTVQRIAFTWGNTIPGVTGSALFGYWDDVIGATLPWNTIQFYMDRVRVLNGWPTGADGPPW